jgi:hypothetical protein
MIHLDPVVMLEEQLAVATAPVLPFEQPSQSRAGARMPPLSSAPVHPVAIVRTAIAPDLDMPGDRYLTVRVEMDGVRTCGRRGKGPTGAEPMPISLDDPPNGFAWMSSVCSGPKLFPEEKIEPCINGLTHTGAVIVCPSLYFGVELADQLAL